MVMFNFYIPNPPLLFIVFTLIIKNKRYKIIFAAAPDKSDILSSMVVVNVNLYLVNFAIQSWYI